MVRHKISLLLTKFAQIYFSSVLCLKLLQLVSFLRAKVLNGQRDWLFLWHLAAYRKHAFNLWGLEVKVAFERFLSRIDWIHILSFGLCRTYRLQTAAAKVLARVNGLFSVREVLTTGVLVFLWLVKNRLQILGLERFEVSRSWYYGHLLFILEISLRVLNLLCELLPLVELYLPCKVRALHFVVGVEKILLVLLRRPQWRLFPLEVWFCLLGRGCNPIQILGNAALIIGAWLI